MKRKLSNTRSGQRSAEISNYMKNIITHGRINMSLSAAKNVMPVIEKEITRAKNDTLHNRRLFAAAVRNSTEIVSKLYNVIAPVLKEKRPVGGYLRIVKYMTYRPDNASRCLLEFVDYNDINWNKNYISNKSHNISDNNTIVEENIIKE